MVRVNTYRNTGEGRLKRSRKKMEQEWAKVWFLLQQLVSSQPREERRVGSPSITSTLNTHRSGF